MHKKGTKQGGEAGYHDPAGFIGTFICPFDGLRVLAGEVAKIVEDRNKDCLIAAIKKHHDLDYACREKEGQREVPWSPS
jgi:hypothetical protein